jgi:Rps23 Pro-64 3,4-dihydroxylase Tpa1-like proline 4-hydroxylase
VNNQELKKLKNEFKTNKPFPHIILSDWFPKDVLDDTLSNVLKLKDTYNWHKLCTNTNDFSPFGEKAVQLTNYLIGDEWLNFLQKLTGIKDLRVDKNWVDAGINYEPRGAHLEPHTDFNCSSNGWRRINLLLFLSKNWKEEWGGYGELGHIEDESFVKDVSYSPDFNKAVLFETSDISYHGFDLVKCPEDESRIVITCYYYSDSSGPHTKSQGTTNYIGWDKERKQDNEYSNRRGTGWKELE